jgi:hypothetical protein
MEDSRDEILARLEDVSRSVEELRRRVALLEMGGATTRAQLSPIPRASPVACVAPEGREAVAALELEEEAENLVPLLGRCLLGLAGAYLLRALTESGFLPGALGPLIGIAYASLWLLLALRKTAEKPMFSVVHGVTASLIMAPMLYEMTVRFHLISVREASVAIVFFAAFGLAVAWRKSSSPLAWIVTLASLAITTALFSEMHDLPAWVVTVLSISAAVEVCACRDHWLGLRWVAALAADLAVLMLTVIATRGAAADQVVQSPALWLTLTLQFGLLTIYLMSTVDRTLLRHLQVSRFEIGQAVAAFCVSIGGALSLTGLNTSSAYGVGVFCLAGGAACYLVSFAFLEGTGKHDRNFNTYSTLALLLATIGFRVMLTSNGLPGAWSLLAVSTLVAGLLADRDTLRVHSLIYMAQAVESSHLIQQSTARVIHSGSGATADVSLGYFVVLIAAMLVYAASAALGRGRRAHWVDPVETFLSAALVCWGAAGLVAGWLSTYVTSMSPARTALLTLLALGAGWLGRRYGRRELHLLAYPMMAIAGVKLIAEDFQEGRSLIFVLSLLLFGAGLIVLPRLLRKRSRVLAAGG